MGYSVVWSDTTRTATVYSSGGTTIAAFSSGDSYGSYINNDNRMVVDSRVLNQAIDQFRNISDDNRSPSQNSSYYNTDSAGRTISTGFVPTKEIKPTIYPFRIPASLEWNAIRMDEPRDNGEASTSMLGYTYEFWTGHDKHWGAGIGGKVYIIKAERSFEIGPIKVNVIGTLGSLGAVASFDPVKWKARAGYHEGVGLEIEVGFK